MWGMGGRSCKDIQVTAAAGDVQSGIVEDTDRCVGSGQPRHCPKVLLLHSSLPMPMPMRLTVTSVWLGLEQLNSNWLYNLWMPQAWLW